MADNVNITPGIGAIIGTRDVGSGVEVQRVIPNTFSGGVATDVNTTNPLPVTQTAVVKVNAGFMATGQTAKQYVGKVTTSTTLATTVTLETVTAGKTYYVTDVLIMSDSSQGASTTVDVRLQAAGVDIMRAGVHNLAPIDMTGIETQPFATTGQVVTLLIPATSAGVVNIWFNIYGFEQ